MRWEIVLFLTVFFLFFRGTNRLALLTFFILFLYYAWQLLTAFEKKPS